MYRIIQKNIFLRNGLYRRHYDNFEQLQMNYVCIDKQTFFGKRIYRLLKINRRTTLE